MSFQGFHRHLESFSDHLSGLHNSSHSVKCAPKVCGTSLHGFIRGVLRQPHRTGNRLASSQSDPRTLETTLRLLCPVYNVHPSQMCQYRHHKLKLICISTFRAVQRGKRINLILLTDLFIKPPFLSASPFLCHSFHEFNQERGSASAWEIKQSERLWACLHSRVCVLTGRTWWPLAPADTHTRPKCSAQQGECYGKIHNSCTPFSQHTSQRAERVEKTVATTGKFKHKNDS